MRSIHVPHPYALIVGPLLVLLMSSVAVGEGEGTISVCEGIEHHKCTLSVVLPESLCLDVDMCSNVLAVL